MLMLPEHSMRSTNVIHLGDCLRVLQSMPSNFVHCIVTSTPYFGLRDYGCAGQVGLEDTPAQFVARLVAIFREARRVLRDDGTLWLNLGDTYGRGTRGAFGTENLRGKEVSEMIYPVSPVMPNKQLMMIPARVAIALQDDGWILRSEIVWHKPNPMPESVTDRPTKSHEMVYLLANSEQYHYDHEAILEPYTEPMNRWGGEKLKADGTSSWDMGTGQSTYRTRNMRPNPNGRNKRSVWSINTQPTPEAHFATFPQKLIEPMILAGCPVGGVVLDPFMGSGTTALVARRLNRDYVGIELNPDYVKMARRRLSEAYTPMMQLFLEATA